MRDDAVVNSEEFSTRGYRYTNIAAMSESEIGIKT